MSARRSWWPRQSGKSRSLAVAALWWAFRRGDQRVLVISAGEDASRRLLAEAAATAVRSPLLAGSVVDENAKRLKDAGDPADVELLAPIILPI